MQEQQEQQPGVDYFFVFFILVGSGISFAFLPGLFSAKWYFMGWKTRDMRQQTWSLWLDSFGLRGPARKRTNWPKA